MVIGYLFKEDVKQQWIKDFVFYLFLSEWLLAICLKKMLNNTGSGDLFYLLVSQNGK